jgi:hypothetical protein
MRLGTVCKAMNTTGAEPETTCPGPCLRLRALPAVETSITPTSMVLLLGSEPHAQHHLGFTDFATLVSAKQAQAIQSQEWTSDGKLQDITATSTVARSLDMV